MELSSITGQEEQNMGSSSITGKPKGGGFDCFTG